MQVSMKKIFDKYVCYKSQIEQALNSYWNGKNLDSPFLPDQFDFGISYYDPYDEKVIIARVLPNVLVMTAIPRFLMNLVFFTLSLTKRF